jgi:hypothetical protein
MSRLVILLLLLFGGVAAAQTVHEHQHGGVPIADGATVRPAQPGQSAFAAIQEIVEILVADPKTDWSRVNVEALRQHLIDMDNVTLHAQVRAEDIDGGMRFEASGTGPVRESIRRMVIAHAAAMAGVGPWQYEAAGTETGAILTVKVPKSDTPKLHALGLIGVMTLGVHHQTHHLMIARGGHPHQ